MATADNLLIAKLSGTAERHALARGSLDDAVVEVRERANGRTDLLAREAATRVGAFLGSPTTSTSDLRAALILAVAAGDIDGGAFVAQVDEVRRRVGTMAHGTGVGDQDPSG